MPQSEKVIMQDFCVLNSEIQHIKFIIITDYIGEKKSNVQQTNEMLNI